MPGWWDSKQNFWAEDAAQDGTSTGNVAWAAMALLTLHQATQQDSFLVDAKRLIDWVIANVSSGSGFRRRIPWLRPATGETYLDID